jgi:hypothetical protein
VNGSLPFAGGDAADGGGLTKVMPSTVGETEGRAVAVEELVGERLAGQALLPGLISANPWNVVVGDGLTLGLSGIGGNAGATPGLVVTVTMMPETCKP